MEKNKTIIIHSKMSYGYVGSNTTSLVLQFGGQDIITVPTVLYSAHLGYPEVGGSVLSGTLYEDILNGILQLNILNEVSSVITGYMGSSELVKITADFIKKVKESKPEINYLCDPVMGDIGRGLYVPHDVPQALMNYLIPLADLLTPNQFEFHQIMGRPVKSIDEVTHPFLEHLTSSQQKIVITGCRFGSNNLHVIETLIVQNGQVKSIISDVVNINPPGTGELFTAHLHLLLLKNKPLCEAVMQVVEIMKDVLVKMEKENRDEFELSDINYSMKVAERIVPLVCLVQKKLSSRKLSVLAKHHD